MVKENPIWAKLRDSTTFRAYGRKKCADAAIVYILAR